MVVQVKNSKGGWVPAIPEPYRVGVKKKCTAKGCRRWYWTMEGYRGHYALEHILFLD